MAERLSHKERVEAALSSESPDRIPTSTWRHFLDQEMTVQGELDSLVAFQRRYDWDYVKINLRAHYHCEDWGVVCTYTGDPHDKATMESTPIAEATDWGNLEVLNPSTGNLGEHLKVISGWRRELGPDVPLLMTMFTPLGIATRMVETEDLMQQHLNENPKGVHAALEAITETFSKYAPLCLEAGADGLFFATLGFGTYDRLSDEEYNQLGRPYDLQVLEQAQDAWFNVLHVCRSNTMLRALSDYPVHAFNWDANDPTNPSLAEGLEITDKAVIGGVPPQEIANISPQKVKGTVREAIEQTGGQRLMIGSGCTMSTHAPHENLIAIKEAISEAG